MVRNDQRMDGERLLVEEVEMEEVKKFKYLRVIAVDGRLRKE